MFLPAPATLLDDCRNFLRHAAALLKTARPEEAEASVHEALRLFEYLEHEHLTHEQAQLLTEYHRAADRLLDTALSAVYA